MTLKLHKMNTDRMMRQPPTLMLVLAPEREYGRVLQQTKQVYDGLLADKHNKLYEALLHRKQEYDNKCTELTSVAGSQDKAMEFGVRAQDALNTMCHDFGDELMALRKDYQEKMNNMYAQLEDKWKADKSKREAADNNGSVPCQVYPHK